MSAKPLILSMLSKASKELNETPGARTGHFVCIFTGGKIFPFMA